MARKCKLRNVNVRRGGFGIMAAMILLLFSCSKDNEFTMGNRFVESDTRLSMIDTFTVALSTVIIDSVVTSGTGVILSGYYEDSIFGKIKAESYFSLGLPNTDVILPTDVYDSAALVMIYSGYHYGDTTQATTLHLRRLSEPIKLNDNGYLYNTSAFSTYPEYIGSASFLPGPGTRDSVRILLDNDIGLLIHNTLKVNPDLTSDEFIASHFNGIVVSPDDSHSSSILGYTAHTDSLKLRIYCHREGTSQSMICLNLPLSGISTQFNRIEHDFSNTDLAPVQQQKTAVPSAQTGNKSFILGGISLVMKVQFPTLGEILMPRGAILKATLVFKPEKTSYKGGELISDLSIYETDRNNSVGNQLIGLDGKAVYFNRVVDAIYHEDSYFSVDVTYFLLAELYDSYYDPTHGLMVTVPPAKNRTTFSKLVVDAARTSAKLRIYYLNL